MSWLNRPLLWLLIALTIGAAARIVVMTRSTLWVDEVFSLAMATGHSLEHPASIADPAMGDFVEGDRPMPPAHWLGYAQHESPPAPAVRVVRAVKLSDTNPPLYYLSLWGWTRLAGTSDAALRGFSVVCSILCLPILWLIARHWTSPRVAAFVAILFAFSPAALFYSTEGRMYSLVWLWGCLLMLFALRVHRHGRWLDLAAMAAVSVLGLYTHYFFVFVLAAAGLWLLIYPGRLGRLAILGGGVLTGLAVFPWYRQLPEIMSAWRVTEGWLKMTPKDFFWPASFGRMVWNLVSTTGVWSSSGKGDILIAPVMLALAALLIHRAATQRWRPAPATLLLWMSAAFPVLGIVAVDVLQGTYAVDVPRYALGALPAVLLLLAIGLDRLDLRLGTIMLLMILLGWAPSMLRFYRMPERNWQDWKTAASMLHYSKRPGDVMVMQSIPSGIINAARYFPADLPIAAWVEQLGNRRVPEDAEALSRGANRVILTIIHDVGASSDLEDWCETKFGETPQLGKLMAGKICIYTPPAPPPADASR